MIGRPSFVFYEERHSSTIGIESRVLRIFARSDLCQR
jgi:hypothetical protein